MQAAAPDHSDYEKIIALAYTHHLRRHPDERELIYWLNTIEGGTTIGEFLKAIEHSDEAAAHPTTSLNDRDIADFVVGIYQSALKRTATGPEIDNWVNAVRTDGKSIQEIGAEIRDSEEARIAKTNSSTEQVLFHLSEPDFEEFLDGLYRKSLDRSPQKAEVDQWMSAASAGMPVSEIVDGIRGSEEALTIKTSSAAEDSSFKVGEEDFKAFLDSLYQSSLSRSPREEEIAQWISAANADLPVSEIVSAIRDGEEAKLRQTNSSVQASDESDATREVIAVLYRYLLNRQAHPPEIENWLAAIQSGLTLSACILEIASSKEATYKRSSASGSSMDGLSNSEFVVEASKLILNRMPTLQEINKWEEELRWGESGRADFLLKIFQTLELGSTKKDARQATRVADIRSHPTNVGIMGTKKTITLKDWERRIGEAESPSISQSRFNFVSSRRARITAVASLYRGGGHIKAFLANMAEQTVFSTDCELIIVDAASPDNESTIIAPFAERYSNVRYVRTPDRISIYEAWNLAIGMAEGEYITNVNVDDLRRIDSFELQAATLDALPFVDVVYQDFLYNFDALADFATIQRVGLTSKLPIVSPTNLFAFNSPHHAPMWRKSLHADIGLFDEGYKSAADYDFWLRCMKADKVFFKLNDPHAAYFFNPEGMSTKPTGENISEIEEIKRSSGAAMLPKMFMTSFDRFCQACRGFGDVYLDYGNTRYESAQEALRMLSRRRHGKGKVSL